MHPLPCLAVDPVVHGCFRAGYRSWEHGTAYSLPEHGWARVFVPDSVVGLGCAVGRMRDHGFQRETAETTSPRPSRRETLGEVVSGLFEDRALRGLTRFRSAAAFSFVDISLRFPPRGSAVFRSACL